MAAAPNKKQKVAGGKAAVPGYPIVLAEGISDAQPVTEEDIPRSAELLPPGHKKYVEFRKALGRLFRQQFPEMDQDKLYILSALPEGYQFAVVKSPSRGREGARTDYYLYGYPRSDQTSVRRNFRSANEFFPHLLWLGSGSKNRADCACLPCLQEEEIAARGGTKGKKVARAGANKKPSAADQQGQPQNQMAADDDADGGAGGAARNGAGCAARNGADDNPYADVGGAVDDAQPVESIFRAGEVVWCQLQPPAWRLGILIKSQVSGQKMAWLIRQFAHHYAIIDPDQLKFEDSIRPFLAFSVPGVDENYLPGLRDQDMQTVDWHALREQHRGDDLGTRKLVLEASKLGAANIDHSFSTFNRRPINDATKDIHGGAFVGCERVEVGDAVRIRINEAIALPSPTDGTAMPFLMSIKEIFTEKAAKPDLHFIGDIWRMQAISQEPQPPPPELPKDLADEMNFRNSVSSRNGIWYEWAKVYENRDANRSQFLGRFYPTHKLMPLANPENHAADIEQGKITEYHVLNTMGDSNCRDIGRKMNRWDTISNVMVHPLGPPLDFGRHVVEEFGHA